MMRTRTPSRGFFYDKRRRTWWKSHTDSVQDLSTEGDLSPKRGTPDDCVQLAAGSKEQHMGEGVRFSLLVSQCHYGIDLGGAAGGDVAGGEACQGHHGYDSYQCCGIMWGDTPELMGQDAGNAEAQD